MASDTPVLIFQGVRTGIAGLEVACAGLEARDPASRAIVNGALKTFVEAGARGGYPLADSAPGQSRLQLASDLALRQGVLTARLNALQVTPSAFQLLRNMLSRLKE